MEAKGRLKGKRILITGAAGYLGSWLAQYAGADGAHVRIQIRRKLPYLSDWLCRFEVSQCDLSDRAALDDACRDRELVWHAASANELVCKEDFPAAVFTNVYGVSTLLEAAMRQGVSTFLKLSTFHVYGNVAANPVTESCTPEPISPYGITNRLGERIGEFYGTRNGINVIVPRISNGYGAPLFKETNRWSLVVNDLARMAFEKKQIVLRGSGVEKRDFVSVPDIYRALVLLSTVSHSFSLVNVGGNNLCSMSDIARSVKKVYERRYRSEIHVTAQGAPPATPPVSVNYDISRLHSLGYVPADTIEEEIDNIFTLLERTQ